MSRMTRVDWKVYAFYRKLRGREAAEQYRHSMNAQHRQYCLEHAPESEWVTIDGWRAEDSYTQKRFLPCHMTEQERERFMEDTWIYAPFSPWDCTGRPFTQWMERYEVPGGTWVYRRIGLDV